MSSPKKGSPVIFATETHILTGQRPRFWGNRISFEMGRDSPDTICNVKPGFGYLSGHPAAMSGLATVTYDPVYRITRHGLSPSQPCVTRWCRLARNGAALMHMPACDRLRHPSSFSRLLSTVPTSFCVVIRSLFWSSLRFSFVSF
jgi:hypothetical protein